MIKNTQKQRGSAHLVIVIILVIVVLGALGYVFWQNLISKDTSYTAGDSKQTTTQSTETPNNPVEDPNDSYLVLEDWKVKFTIPESLNDTSIKYFARKSNDNPPVISYSFTTSRIQDLGGECAKLPFGDTAMLIRFAEDQMAYTDSYWVSPDKVDGYRYVLSGPIAGCSMVNENGQVVNPESQIEAKDRDSLIELVESIESTE